MKAVKITNGGVSFDDGSSITDYHNQDCCEQVYADWEQIDDLFTSQDFESISIEQVEGNGFKINGFFVPCYNNQNGYYSSDLALIIISTDGKKIEIDISNSVKDNID